MKTSRSIELEKARNKLQQAEVLVLLYGEEDVFNSPYMKKQAKNIQEDIEILLSDHDYRVVEETEASDELSE